MRYNFTFTLTEEDVYTFNRYHIRNSPAGRKTVNRLRLFFPAMLILVAAFNAVMLETRLLPLALSGALIILWFIFFNKFIDWSVRRSLKRAAKKGRLIDSQEVRVAFDEGGILEQVGESEAKADYSAFERVASDESGVYLYNSAMTARVIPRRAFTSPDEMAQFVQFLDGRL